jgi:hypothetical protein
MHGLSPKSCAPWKRRAGLVALIALLLGVAAVGSATGAPKSPYWEEVSA